jgi:4-carboxymuconolactone decarboxylase
MTTQDERFQQGQEIRARFGGGTVGAGSVPAARDIAPDLNRILGEFLFGSIWPRPALEAEQREMSTLSVLTVLQRQTQLRRHLGNALNLGLTPEQIVEVLIHMVWYGGAPATLNGLGLATEVFAERGIDFTPQPVYDPTEDLETVYQRGVARRIELMGEGSQGAGREPVTNAEREFSRLTGEYYWGSVWTRPGLDLQSRSICTLSALTVLGREGPLRSHIQGALHIGLTEEQIIEVFIHTTFYGGLPFTRAAMDIANEIFRSG